MSDLLYMQTGEMGGYQAPAGPTPPQLTRIQSQMAEGNYYAERDHVTCQSLGDYVPKCNEGLTAYTSTAHHATNLYVGTDQAAAQDLNYLSDQEYSARAFDVANATPGERPKSVPEPLELNVDAFEQE